jgi:2-methylisocitrate lyase-like PEP mutase family enzyme
MPTPIDQKRTAFRRLHESGCFVIPNPWDVGSARYLQGLGFKALATTSSGFAWTLGAPDNFVGVETMLRHLREIAEVADIPVNADFEGGYAEAPEGVAANVVRAVETGVSGLSIEDSTGRKEQPLYDFGLALERVKAARAAIDRTRTGTVFTARAECFLVGHPDPLKESIKRLEAYAAAGADCLYAPGIRTPEQISAVVKAVAPKPVNVLMAWPGLSVAQLADLGVRRISVGGALARAAWGEFVRVAKEIAEQGSFEGFGRAAAGGTLTPFFREDLAKRGKMTV